MKEGAQTPGVGWSGQSSPGKESQGTERAFIGVTPNTHTYSILFQKHLIEFLNVFQKQKDPNQR